MISFSQYSIYAQCPHKFKLRYVDGIDTKDASIETVFGIAFHTTLQRYIRTMFTETIKAADELDLSSILLQEMKEIYIKVSAANGEFSNAAEMSEYYADGVAILDFFRKKRANYLQNKNCTLIGIEFPLNYKLPNNIDFIGYIDVIIYDKLSDRYRIIDIKTSKSGWKPYHKKDFVKTSQLLLYKHFYSKLYNIDLEKIDVEYLIVRRKINEKLQFVPKRIQQFVPSNGSKSMKKSVESFNRFITECFDDEGSYKKDRKYIAKESKLCPYCVYNNEEQCPSIDRVRES